VSQGPEANPDAVIVFLRIRAGVMVADLERAKEERADEVERVEAERAKRLAKAKQVAIPLSVVYGERMQMTLREAARRVLDAGGRIGRGELGELRITVPEKLTDDPLAERSARSEVATAAEVLTIGWRVVLAAVDDQATDGSKQPRRLDERLPDREPAFGGGVV
jgi:hypothetical protein